MELNNLSSDKTIIFLYAEGKLIEGKISNEIINDELIESIKNIVEPLSKDEKINLHFKVRASIHDF